MYRTDCDKTTATLHLQVENLKVQNSKKQSLLKTTEESMKETIIRLQSDCQKYKVRCDDYVVKVDKSEHMLGNVKAENDNIRFAFQTTQQAVGQYEKIVSMQKSELDELR